MQAFYTNFRSKLFLKLEKEDIFCNEEIAGIKKNWNVEKIYKWG